MGVGIEVKDFAGARTALSRLCQDQGSRQARIHAVLPRFFASPSAQALRNIAATALAR
jgi:hypothetical protein